MGDPTLGSSMQAIAAESGKGIGSAMKGAGSTDDGGMNELYKLNQIWYRMPPTLSIVAKRTILINAAQQTKYTNPFNQTLSFVFNTGEFYISAFTSYLRMMIGYNDPAQYGRAKALIAQGNAMQLIEEVVFTSASGTEVAREQNKGLYESFKYRYTHNQDYIDTAGQVQGAPTGKYSAIHDGVGPVPKYTGQVVASDLDSAFGACGGQDALVLPRSGSGARDFFGVGCHNLNKYSANVTKAGVVTDLKIPSLPLLAVVIPLNQVIGCFAPYMKTLIPAGLLAGGRLDIRFKNPTESLQFIAANTDEVDTPSTELTNLIAAQQSGFVVQDIYIGFDAFQLMDASLKRLNMVAAGTDGLSLLYNLYDYTTTNKAGTGRVECQVQQARSRIIRSWCVVRDMANIRNPYINSLAAEAAIRRVCGKINPGSQGSPCGNTTATGGVFGGIGGISWLSAIKAGSADAKYTVADLIASGVIYPMMVQPPLPIDPYLGDVPARQPTVASYQGVLGALYFPQQPLTTLDEYYQNALYVWGYCVGESECTGSVTFEDFLGGTGTGLYSDNNGTPKDPSDGSNFGIWVAPYGLAIYGLIAEKSQALQLSGLPISNARLLRHIFEFTFTTLSTLDRQITCFTEYTRVAKVFLGGRIVVRE